MISGKNNFYDTLSIAKDVKPGYITTFSVQPIEVKGTNSLQEMAESQRNCKYPHEINSQDSHIFKTYSQASCEFECQVQFARDRCLCTPWNLPFRPNAKVFTILDNF